MRQIVLGADAGTHGVRVLAVGLPDGSVLGSGIRYYERGGDSAQELEETFLEALQALTLPADASVTALGITHRRGTVIPVDEACRPLAPAFCDSDDRALDGVGFLRHGIDPAAYYAVSGCPVVSFNGFAKVLWCRENMPALYGRAAAWLSPQDYLLSRLSGTLQMSQGSALRSGFLDVRARRMNTELLSGADFLRVPCVPVGECCGVVSDRWEKHVPWLKGVSLFAVPGDQPAAVLGAGAAGGACMAMNLGTTFVTSVVGENVCSDGEGLVTTEILPLGLYAPEFGTGAGGQFMDFLTRTLWDEIPQDSPSWSRLDELAAGVAAGADGLRIVPLLWQATSPGVSGRIEGLRAEHARAHFLRAAYEGLAYEAEIAVRKMTAACGRRADTIRVFGGLSACCTFLQILSSVTGKTVEAAGEKQASAYGAALTAAIGLGVIHTAEDLRDVTGRTRLVCRPETEEYERYETEFERYCRQR